MMRTRITALALAVVCGACAISSAFWLHAGLLEGAVFCRCGEGTLVFGTAGCVHAVCRSAFADPCRAEPRPLVCVITERQAALADFVSRSWGWNQSRHSPFHPVTDIRSTRKQRPKPTPPLPQFLAQQPQHRPHRPARAGQFEVLERHFHHPVRLPHLALGAAWCNDAVAP